ncbi:MAG: prolyl-tRNA synthetase associated domain-containing protein [Alphaproteobacteria bacterium]|nr:prolyl-tRNA synthetase associated domain-containing protein [Alphaproteobacteria bacterium]
MHNEQTLLNLLDQLGIKYGRKAHEPVFTCEQADALLPELRGQHCKNLFVKDRDDKKWLLVVPADRRADLKLIAEKIGSKRLSFCSAEEMQAILGVAPGAASPLAMINDSDNQVTLVLDETVAGWDAIHCHPLTNLATVSIPRADFEKFIQYAKHDLNIESLA